MDRRDFLLYASGLLTSASLTRLERWSAYAKEPTPPPGIATADGGFSAEQWDILASVQQHLFPSEPEAPGANDVNAAAYLRFVLTQPDLDPADRDFLGNGLNQLQTIARESSPEGFIALLDDEREAALRRLETTHEGRHWLGRMLHYVFEALLTDPVYGGNPNGIGWQWLRHHPGRHRPPAEKRYYLL